MTARTAHRTAITLLLVEGLSGVLVSITLFSAGFARSAPTGLGVAAGMLIYGLLLAIAGLGLIRGHRWARILAGATLVAGLALLTGITLVLGPDAVILSGVAIWGATLVCLFAGRRPAS